MTSQDKYSIVQQLEESLQKPEIPAKLEHYPDVLVNDIWEVAYPMMPLCDPDDSSPEKLMQVLKQLTLSLIKSSVSGVIESLKRKKRIAVPDKVTISGTSLSKINVCFKSHKVIRCSLEELEGRLVKEFGIQDKDQCNDMHQSEYNTSGRK